MRSELNLSGTYKKKNLIDKSDDYFSKERPEMMEFIPEDVDKVLDVGCGEGVFGQQIKEKLDVEVWGVEVKEDVAEIAQKALDNVLVGDISQIIRELPNDYFDCIVFNDVLEHLEDLYGTLRKIKKKVSEEGVIICSIPNVRYLPILIDLLVKKQWKYVDHGILDRTHLRFFTKNSIIDMFDSLGYEILQFKGINELTSWKYKLINTLFLGFLSDTRYLQFACVAKPI